MDSILKSYEKVSYVDLKRIISRDVMKNIMYFEFMTSKQITYMLYLYIHVLVRIL